MKAEMKGRELPLGDGSTVGVFRDPRDGATFVLRFLNPMDEEELQKGEVSPRSSTRRIGDSVETRIRISDEAREALSALFSDPRIRYDLDAVWSGKED